MADAPASSRFTRIREWVQFGILVFATAWGVYTFILKDIIRPAQRPTALELTTTLEEVGRSASSRMIRIRIVCSNPSDRRIYIPALWYTVWGHKLAEQDQEGFLHAVESAEPRTIAGRYARIVRTDVVASGRVWVDSDTWYDPHDRTTDEAIFSVPVKLFDFLESRVDYWFLTDIGMIGKPRWELQRDGSWVPILTVKSQEGSRLEDFDPTSNPRHRKLELTNQLGQNRSVASLSLWPNSPSR